MGFGLELKTEHATALRAGRGMLLSADMRTSGQGTQLDAQEAHQQIDASAQLQTALSTTAQQHNAGVAGDGAAEPAPEKLPAIADMTASAQALAGTSSGSTANGGGGGGGGGNAATFSKAQLQMSAPKGIVAITPVSALFQAGASSAIVAGQDLNFAAQGNALHAVKAGISIFTYGKASAADKPNQETGIALHAASGKLSSQSQSDATQLTADKLITVASVTKNVTVAAKEHVLLTAQGAYLRLEGGDISIHGPGTMLFKASMKELTGPASASVATPALPHGDVVLSNDFHRYAAQYQVLGGELPMPNQAYVLTLPDGNKYFGETDADGKTVKVGTLQPKDVKLTLLEKEDWDQENINVWHQEMDKNWD